MCGIAQGSSSVRKVLASADVPAVAEHGSEGTNRLRLHCAGLWIENSMYV